MTELKSKVLYSTYALIVSSIIYIVLFIYNTKHVVRIVYPLVFVISIILAILYIKAVKNNNTSYMKRYNTLLIVYMILVLLTNSGLLLRLLGLFLFTGLSGNNSPEEKSSLGLYGLIIVISLVLIGYCAFIIYYQRIVSKYYHHAKEEYTQVEENTNRKIISESKLIIFTYVLIVLIIMLILLFIYKTFTKSESKRDYQPLLIFIINLILSLYFIKAVKNKNTSYMKIYEIIYIIYIVFIVIIGIVFVYVLYRQYVDKESVTWKEGIISIVIAFVVSALFIYYTVLIDKYCNQVKIEKKTVEESRNLEANVSITNETNN